MFYSVPVPIPHNCYVYNRYRYHATVYDNLFINCLQFASLQSPEVAKESEGSGRIQGRKNTVVRIRIRIGIQVLFTRR
jgi:hypothetical protein